MAILMAQLNTQDIEQLLGGTWATWEYDQHVTKAHEGLEALFDIRHDHEVGDKRIRRLSGDNRRLGQTKALRAGGIVLQGMAL